MRSHIVRFAAIAVSLALVLGTVAVARGVLDDARFHAGQTSAAPYTFDGARIVMR